VLCLLAGLGLLAAPQARAAEQGLQSGLQPGLQTGLQIGLEGVAFKDFLLFMGQFSGKNPVFRLDQLPDATVTLVSRQSVAEGELAEMQALVLGVAGLSATPRGEVVYLLPAPGRPAQAAGPTQILVERLGQGLAPGQVAHVLERLRSDEGQVAASGQGRWVVIRDQAERVARARAVLAALQAAPAGAGLELAPLRRVEARLAARKLDMHFRGLPGRAPVVMPLEWSNSVLLAGDPDQLAQALRLLSQLDEGGREAPALRAFRLRYARAEKVAGVLRELAESDKRLSALRVRVDAEAGAVVVLAEPELMARVERLVADLDQPRPRVLLEALVLELPAQISGQDAVLALSPGPGGGATVLANPPPGAPAGTSGFAQATLGLDVRLRGRAPAGVPEGTLTGLAGLDVLAAHLAAAPEVRVLARPRAAVPDGGKMRLSITRPAVAGTAAAGAGPGVERERLVFMPLQDADTGQLSVRVSLEDAAAPGRPQAVEAQLPEGALLLLVARGAEGAGQGGARRLGILLTARVGRGGGLSETKP